ncbi:tail fiber assembly protein [Pseudomonas sp. Root562]|uniref:tail fiber assembly protein n=1 Tax=Pseudomonas sp. Root562 TaxID=1736561 RepID=UPI000703BAE9|nr:tail fiber assembly protein [Pseudomonas sp. Root562]KQZ80636.1 hypothetical protein ASD60_14985 [Pseudomonas sp. Root562]
MNAIYLMGQAGILSGPFTLAVVPGIGCQMPDNAVELPQVLEPPAVSFVWVLLEGVPVLLADHRGPVYSTATGEAEQFDELGELPEGLTLDPPPSPFHVWVSGAWALDSAAQTQAKAIEVLAERDSRLRTAAIRIAPLQDAQELGEATAEEAAALLKWKRYRIDLNRIEQQVGYPQSVAWPSPPGLPEAS